MSQYYNDEIMHYGVKGMRWGHRKKYYNDDGSLNARGQARQDYKDARKATRQANREFKRSSYTAIGMKGLDKYRSAEKNAHDAALRELDAKAKYNASKQKTQAKADKAELKTYAKAMAKTGLAGSYNDTKSGGKSSRIYDNLQATKGKEYADRVAKRVQNRAFATIATAAVVTVGSQFVADYYMNNRK